MRQRGLTLIEVLVSTALLTMIAVACVPLLRQALATFHQGPKAQQLDLASIADALLRDPAQFAAVAGMANRAGRSTHLLGQNRSALV